MAVAAAPLPWWRFLLAARSRRCCWLDVMSVWMAHCSGGLTARSSGLAVLLVIVFNLSCECEGACIFRRTYYLVCSTVYMQPAILDENPIFVVHHHLIDRRTFLHMNVFLPNHIWKKHVVHERKQDDDNAQMPGVSSTALGIVVAVQGSCLLCISFCFSLDSFLVWSFFKFIMLWLVWDFPVEIGFSTRKKNWCVLVGCYKIV